MADHGDWGNKPLFSEADWRSGTEYGGVGGLIPPIDSPHTESITPAEEWLVIRNINPTDAGTAPVAETKQIAP